MISEIFSPHKVLRHHEAMSRIAKGCETLPVVLSIDPSAMCNQNCIWCSGTGYVNKCTARLSKELLLKLAADAKRMGIKAAFFTGGGEPLCNPHMADAILEFANNGIQTGLVTNGTLLEGKVVETAAMFCEWVRVSIDAVTPGMYRRTHETSSTEFHRVLENVGELIRLRHAYRSECVIGLSFLVHPANYREIYDFAHYASMCGADYVQFKPLLTISKWFSEDDMSKAIINDMARAKDDLERDDFHVLANFGRFQHVTVGYKRPYGRCLGHNLIGCVLATGRMNICCHQRARENYTFGDLNKDSFEKVWYGDDRKKAIDSINLNECPSCKYEMYNQYLWTMQNPPRHANFI